MSKLRSVSTSFWSDPFIEELTTNQKLLYLYFITNEKTNMLGIYEVSIKKISYDTGISAPDVIKALKVFEGLNKVNYIDNYIILNNFLKHQNFNTNMMKSAIDCYNELPKSLKHKGVIVDKSNPLESFRTLSNALLMVRKVETEVEVEVETEVEVEVEKESEKEQKLTHSEFDQFDEIDLEKSQLLKEFLKYKKSKNEEIKSSIQIESIFKTMLDVDIGDLKIIIKQTINSGSKNIIWNYANELKQKNKTIEVTHKPFKSRFDTAIEPATPEELKGWEAEFEKNKKRVR